MGRTLGTRLPCQHDTALLARFEARSAWCTRIVTWYNHTLSEKTEKETTQDPNDQDDTDQDLALYVPGQLGLT